MNTRNRKILITVLLILSVGNFNRISSSSNIRTVEFLSVLVIGILTGLLLREFFEVIFKKTDKS